MITFNEQYGGLSCLLLFILHICTTNLWINLVMILPFLLFLFAISCVKSCKLLIDAAVGILSISSKTNLFDRYVLVLWVGTLLRVSDTIWFWNKILIRCSVGFSFHAALNSYFGGRGTKRDNVSNQIRWHIIFILFFYCIYAHLLSKKILRWYYGSIFFSCVLKCKLIEIVSHVAIF